MARSVEVSRGKVRGVQWYVNESRGGQKCSEVSRDEVRGVQWYVNEQGGI